MFLSEKFRLHLPQLPQWPFVFSKAPSGVVAAPAGRASPFHSFSQGRAKTIDRTLLHSSGRLTSRAKPALNGPPVAPHGLILSRDEAMPSRMLSTSICKQFPIIFDRFGDTMGHQGVKGLKIIYVYIYISLKGPGLFVLKRRGLVWGAPWVPQGARLGPRHDVT